VSLWGTAGKEVLGRNQEESGSVAGGCCKGRCAMKKRAATGGIDKKKLLKQVQRMSRRAKHDREKEEAANAARVKEVKAGIEACTETILRLRDEMGSAAHTAAKQRREGLRRELVNLMHSIDPSTEFARINAAMDATKAAWSAHKERRRQSLRAAAVAEMYARAARLGGGVQHPVPFRNDMTIQEDVIQRWVRGLMKRREGKGGDSVEVLTQCVSRLRFDE
jgi:hypothetical protein